MKRKHLIGSLALAALFALPSLGCVVRGSGGAYISGPSVAVVEVEQEPPPPRVVHVTARPGFIWIDGRWNWRGGRWVWMDGRYERQRVGHYYAPGRWERRGRGHVYVEGRWQAGGNNHGRVQHNNGRRNGPAVRDHRDKRRDNRDKRRDNGPVIRDHRR